MGKKPAAQKPTKKKQKQQVKADEPAEEAKPKRKAQKNDTPAEVELLPKVLSEKFAQFGNLLTQINKQNIEAGKSDSFNVHDRKQKLAQKIQQACKNVFRSQTKEAQNWLQNEQQNLNQKSKKLNDTHQKAQQVLQSSKSFSKEQINDALKIFDTKFSQISKTAANNDRLLDLVKGIYLT